MKFSTLIGITLTVSGTLAVSELALGYFIRLAPLGLLTPLFYLALVLALLILVVSSIVAATRSRSPARERLAFVLVIFAIACLPWVKIWTIEGFEYRVRQTNDASWMRLATDAQEMLRASTPNRQLPDYPDHDWNRRYVLELAKSHPVLRLGDFPPKLFVEEDSVSIDWGSGLIGSRSVHISTGSNDARLKPQGDRSRRISDVVTIGWD